jgi:putative transposase
MQGKITMLRQITQMISRYDFQKAVLDGKGRNFVVSFSYWSQFVAMLFGQLSEQLSLRDLVLNLSRQAHRFYHLGLARICRSTFSDANNHRPSAIYENLYYILLNRYSCHFKGKNRKLKNKLYSVDSTVIDLCLSLFGWAKFRTTKAGVKLHTCLDHDGYIPSFAVVTNACVHDSRVKQMFDLPAGSIVTFDKGYNDYHLFNLLNDKGIIFVTRQKDNAAYKVIKRNKTNRKRGITSDHLIEFTGYHAKQKCSIKLRRIRYIDNETSKIYVFLTNDFHHAASTIADIYKQRWQIELFFKALKQNLVIKTFWGTSQNAVLSQIWVALIIYLLMSVLKYKYKIMASVGKLIQRIRAFMFENDDILRFIKDQIPIPIQTDSFPLFNQLEKAGQ